MALRLSTGLRNKLLGINTNKLTNGSFTTDTTGWTGSEATLTRIATGGVSNGPYLEIAESGGSLPGKASVDLSTKIGHLYFLEWYFKKGTADSGKVMIGTTEDEDASFDSGNLSDAAWTVHRTWFLATATTTRVTLQTNDTTTGETSLFDEIRLVSMSRALQDVFKDGFVKIYTGTQPASADEAPSGTLLVTIYSDGSSAGLEFDDATSGTLTKKATETWSGTAVQTGTAGWFRLQAPGDGEGASITDERMDGAIATSGAQLNMSSTSIVQGAVQTINSFSITIPAS
jgi:hypothetical protein